MKLLLTILLILGVVLSFGQNEERIDSLKKAISQAKDDSKKIDLLVSLGEEYSVLDSGSDSLLTMADDLMMLCQKVGDHCNEAVAYHYRGNYHYYKTNLDEALDAYKMSLQIREKHCQPHQIASSTVMLGNVYSVMANYKEAYHYYYRSLDIYEKIDDKTGISSVHVNIGSLDVSREKFDEALEHYKFSLAYEETSGDSASLANVLNSLGGLYQVQEKFDTALVYFDRAMDIFLLIDQKNGLAHGYNNIGIIHYYKGYEDSCLFYFKKSLVIREEIGEKRAISQSYNNIGILYMYQEQFENAILYSDSALAIAIESGAREEISDAHKSLYEIYFEKGDYYNSVLSLKNFADYKDTLASEQSERLISEMETKYNTVQKEKEIQEKNIALEQKNASIKRQKIIISASIFIGVLLAFLVVQVYKRNKLTKAQNIVIAEQKLIVEQKQREMIDSITYAKRIQEALLKSEEHESPHLPDHFIFFKPKDIVSGDFYWVKEKGHYLYLAVADCTGHGVPGAFLTMLGSSFLNEIVAESDSNTPAQILDKLREKVVYELSQTGEAGENKDGMDISLVRLNLEDLSIMWAGANNPLWVIQSSTINEYKASDNRSSYFNDLLEIKGDKQPIGHFWEMTPFTNHSFQLEKGDNFYLFSDGFADQFGGDKGKKYKYKPLKQLLLNINSSSMEERKNNLSDEFENWKGKLEQVDDVCIIGVQV
jgi:serine phosphatase RsbU (regulator of sigma subunit)